MTNPTRYTVDPGHSAVGFSVRHMMITNVRGEFEKYQGTVEYDAEHPENMRIDVSIDIESLNTRHPQRDGNLRSELFFDVGRFPAATFVSKSARSVAPRAVDVTGALTLHGVAHELTLAVRDLSDVTTDLRGGKRIGATAMVVIQRSDYGITWNKTLDAGGLVLGEEVKLALEVSLVQTP